MRSRPKTKEKAKSSTAKKQPRIGVPWRSAKDESEGRRKYYDFYLDAVRDAGGEPVEISLSLEANRLADTAVSLDGAVLPGSPADVNASLYSSVRHGNTADPDPRRESTDTALLNHMLAVGKPVLAICYGAQLLNVHLHGTLVQDIPSEMRNAMDHDGGAGRTESLHPIRIEGGELAGMAGGSSVCVNSSHHQSVQKPGRGLRVAARAPDGVIEALEWTAGPGWAVGVQWHPERMPDDPFAAALFRRLVKEAQDAAGKPKSPVPRARRRARRSKSSR